MLYSLLAFVSAAVTSLSEAVKAFEAMSACVVLNVELWVEDFWDKFNWYDGRGTKVFVPVSVPRTRLIGLLALGEKEVAGGSMKSALWIAVLAALVLATWLVAYARADEIQAEVESDRATAVVTITMTPVEKVDGS